MPFIICSVGIFLPAAHRICDDDIAVQSLQVACRTPLLVPTVQEGGALRNLDQPDGLRRANTRGLQPARSGARWREPWTLTRLTGGLACSQTIIVPRENTGLHARPTSSASKLHTRPDSLRILFTIFEIYRAGQALWLFSSVALVLAIIDLATPILLAYIEQRIAPRFPTQSSRWA